MRKYFINEDFFEKIDCENKAYFLGFLYADGYINNIYNVVDLTLHKKDIEILKKFSEFIFPRGKPLRIVRNEYVRLQINSKKIVSDLNKHGCFQKKTFYLEFPNLDEHLIKHFMRGYFDGDGCVTINNKSLIVSVVGTEMFLIKFGDVLKYNCNLNETKLDIRFPERNKNIRSLIYGGNIIVNRIYHYLYDDAEIFLYRKQSKFLAILSDKIYFYNKNYSRKKHDKFILYDGVFYNKTELSKLLSLKLDVSANTIRKKLTYGWSVDEILSLKSNHKRHNFLKKVIKYDLNGFEVKYESVLNASIDNKCRCESIYQAISKNKKLNKYFWKYEY